MQAAIAKSASDHRRSDAPHPPSQRAPAGAAIGGPDPIANRADAPEYIRGQIRVQLDVRSTSSARVRPDELRSATSRANGAAVDLDEIVERASQHRVAARVRLREPAQLTGFAELHSSAARGRRDRPARSERALATR